MGAPRSWWRRPKRGRQRPLKGISAGLSLLLAWGRGGEGCGKGEEVPPPTAMRRSGEGGRRIPSARREGAARRPKKSRLGRCISAAQPARSRSRSLSNPPTMLPLRDLPFPIRSITATSRVPPPSRPRVRCWLHHRGHAHFHTFSTPTRPTPRLSRSQQRKCRHRPPVAALLPTSTVLQEVAAVMATAAARHPLALARCEAYDRARRRRCQHHSHRGAHSHSPPPPPPPSPSQGTIDSH